MSRGHYDNSRPEFSRYHDRLKKEATPSLKRHKGRKRRLSLDERIEAVHRVLVQKELQADVAKHFRVTAPTISRLVSKMEKRPALLSELLSKRDEKLQERW